MLEKYQQVLNRARNKGIPFAEIFNEDKQTRSFLLEDKKIEKITLGRDKGSGYRIVDQDKTYYGYTNDDNKLAELAEQVGQTYRRSIEASVPVKLVSKDIPMTMPPLQNEDFIVERLQQANELLYQKSKHLKQVRISYADVVQDIIIGNSENLFRQGRRSRQRLFIQVVGEKNGVMQTSYEGPGCNIQQNIWEQYPLEPLCDRIISRLHTVLDAPLAPASTMTVVLAGSAGGTLVHEACGHALEADFIHKKTSVFTDKLGEQALSGLITVVDDGSMPGHYGTQEFDDEGTETTKNILIENGRVRAFMTDMLNARMLGLPLSGNGRRESYQYPVQPRMTNTYIENGSSDPEDIIASVDQGLLIKKMGGGQVDITSGEFVFEISEAYLINNGKVDHPVRGATLVGNGIKVLSEVDMVGNDKYFIPGVCGKGDGAPVTDAIPTIRIPSIVVGGMG